MKEKQICVGLPLIVYVDGVIFYAAQNQLLSETIGNDTTSYTYDTAGNIRSITGPSISKSFSYNDTGDWKDLLTSVTVNGTTRNITYETSGGVTIGNPLSYFNGTQYSLAWQNGRQLASLSGGGKSATYTYGADGIRTSKTVTDASGTMTYQYTTQNGQIARQSWTAGGTAYQMDFVYDAAGRPLAMYYRSKAAGQADFNGDSHYYETNQQGDVTGLYKITYDATTKSLSATRVASYEYDAWGNVTYSTGEMADINPLRYRGYYQDWESGYYYLQSRYYDPVIGRFINADKPELVDVNFCKNLFAYSGNNPISLKDDEGTVVISAAVVGASLLCGLLGGLISAGTTHATGGDKTNVVYSFLGGFAAGALAPLGNWAYLGAGIAGVFTGLSDCHTQKKAGKEVNYVQAISKGFCTFGTSAIVGAQFNGLQQALALPTNRLVTAYAVSRASAAPATLAEYTISTYVIDPIFSNQSGRSNHTVPTQTYIDSLDTYQGNRGHTYHGYTY